MKKLLALAICAALFSGCSDSTELGSRAIIQAVAIDYDGGYKLSALLFSSGGSGGDNIDASQENVIRVDAEGLSLAEAVDNLSLIDGKRIYMSETKLLILGGGFSATSVTDALKTLYFDMRCGLNTAVCCTENAAAITELRFTEGITSAEKPLSVIENGYEAGVSPKATLLDLLCDSVSGNTSEVPMLAITENGSGMTSSEDAKIAVLNGSRTFRNGFLAEFHDPSETRAITLISGKTDKTAVNYLYNNEEKTCEAYCIKVRNSDGRWTVSAKFRARNGGSLPEPERKAALDALGQIVERGL